LPKDYGIFFLLGLRVPEEPNSGMGMETEEPLHIADYGMD
jgi:hypothetical protein